MIMNIIRKHQKKKELLNISTFYGSSKEEETMKRVGVRYYPDVTNKLKPIFRAHKVESARSALGSIKDVPPDLHKSGIYRVQCSTCGSYYFGLTIRKLYVRFNEYVNSKN